MSLDNDVIIPRSIPASVLEFTFLFPTNKLKFLDFYSSQRFPTIKQNVIPRDSRRIKLFLNLIKSQ